MKQYLTEEQIKTNLRLGKSLEQWIGFFEQDDYTILRWLRIDKEKNQVYSVTYFESFDEGNENFLDIYEFSLVDPDEPFGVINTFASTDEAMQFATLKYSASSFKYITAGTIQEEYKDYITR
ncbi:MULTISPECIES: hypothetical protein [unclassified Sphingobacterium]|uniref:hypothetical protein n=1 Tax=unclassified Sphingobacterium TaxID=2609468 RepID=UPI001050E3C2|nr:MULTISPECIES: hypothetical protein [unclassified Sphingobacterium]MCS3556468.1 hypothetical protein [Sphingobacterium sp. JUb21]TCR08833.1 hypothetical protein EDF66_103385 [Sphingobacterium sp. JUb20]